MLQDDEIKEVQDDAQPAPPMAVLEDGTVIEGQDEYDELVAKEPQRGGRGKRQVEQDDENHIQIRNLGRREAITPNDLFLIDNGINVTDAITYGNLFKFLRDRIFKSGETADQEYYKNIIKSTISNTLSDDETFKNSVFTSTWNKIRNNASDYELTNFFEAMFDKLSSYNKMKMAEKLLESLNSDTHFRRGANVGTTYEIIAKSSSSSSFKRLSVNSNALGAAPRDYSGYTSGNYVTTGTNRSSHTIRYSQSYTNDPATGTYSVASVNLSDMHNKHYHLRMGYHKSGEFGNSDNSMIVIVCNYSDLYKYYYLDVQIQTRINARNVECSNVVVLNYSSRPSSLYGGSFLIDMLTATNAHINQRRTLLSGWYQLNGSSSVPLLVKC